MESKNKRKDYPKHRKYQAWNLKRLIKAMENNLFDLNEYVLSTNQHQARLKETKEMMFELALRLD